MLAPGSQASQGSNAQRTSVKKMTEAAGLAVVGDQ